MRGFATCSIAVAVIVSLAFFLPSAPVVRYPLRVGQVYSATVVGDAVQLDLPPGDGSDQYLLVVASLATDTARRSVSLSRRPISQVEEVPLVRVKIPRHRRLSTKPGDEASAAPGAAQRSREFWIPVAGGSSENPATYRSIQGKLAGQGPHVRVYVDSDDRVSQATVQSIIDVYEARVYPTAAEYLGLPRDVDGDGVLTIFVTGWLGRLDDGRVSLGGMVRSSDFQPDVRPPFSNRSDILYLNSSVRPGPHLETLLAHELAHGVTCSQRFATSSWLFPAVSEESWLNEAISHVAENVESTNWSNLDYRVAQYLSSPDTSPLVVADYRRAGLWRDPGCRGACYLFLRWCVDRYGTELLPELVYSSRAGIANLESATGETFAELFRRFSVDLYLSSVSGESSEEQAASSADVARVELSEPLGRWGLAGPRVEVWDSSTAGSREMELALSGTTMRHLIVRGKRPSAERITIQAEPGTKLQVSLVRLPDSLPQLKLDLVASDHGWRLLVEELAGTEVRLTHIAWENPDDKHETMPSHRYLGESELSRLFDDQIVPGGGQLTSQPFRFPAISSGRLLVRVAGIDREGRRVAAWCDVDLQRGGLQLAMHR